MDRFRYATQERGWFSLPPAAIQGREPRELIPAASGWSFLERIALSNGICPRCSGTVDRHLSTCEDHDADDGLCNECGRHNQEVWTGECSNCPLDVTGTLPSALHGYPPILNFVTAHKFNPVVPTEEQWATMTDAYEVDVLSLEPLRARITYSLAGDELRLTVDDELNTVEVTRSRDTATD